MLAHVTLVLHSEPEHELHVQVFIIITCVHTMVSNVLLWDVCIVNVSNDWFSMCNTSNVLTTAA